MSSFSCDIYRKSVLWLLLFVYLFHVFIHNSVSKMKVRLVGACVCAGICEVRFASWHGEIRKVIKKGTTRG